MHNKLNPKLKYLTQKLQFQARAQRFNNNNNNNNNNQSLNDNTIVTKKKNIIDLSSVVTNEDDFTFDDDDDNNKNEKNSDNSTKKTTKLLNLNANITTKNIIDRKKRFRKQLLNNDNINELPQRNNFSRNKRKRRARFQQKRRF